MTDTILMNSIHLICAAGVYKYIQKELQTGTSTLEE
jgi:hypothetical protein